MLLTGTLASTDCEWPDAMPSATDQSPERQPSAAERKRRAEAARRAADALLREQPGARVFAQTADGSLVALPESLGLASYPTLSASEERTGADMCVAEDRMTIINA